MTFEAEQGAELGSLLQLNISVDFPLLPQDLPRSSRLEAMSTSAGTSMKE